jgi:hypothetical protein
MDLDSISTNDVGSNKCGRDPVACGDQRRPRTPRVWGRGCAAVRCVPRERQGVHEQWFHDCRADPAARETETGRSAREERHEPLRPRQRPIHTSQGWSLSDLYSSWSWRWFTYQRRPVSELAGLRWPPRQSRLHPAEENELPTPCLLSDGNRPAMSPLLLVHRIHNRSHHTSSRLSLSPTMRQPSPAQPSPAPSSRHSQTYHQQLK